MLQHHHHNITYFNGTQIDTLQSILIDDQQTFDKLSMNFMDTFKKSLQFRGGCCMAQWLDDDNNNNHHHHLTPSQRLTALFILCDMHSSVDIGYNPFLCVFFSVFASSIDDESDPNSSNNNNNNRWSWRQFEKRFVSVLLCTSKSRFSEIRVMTPRHCCETKTLPSLPPTWKEDLLSLANVMKQNAPPVDLVPPSDECQREWDSAIAALEHGRPPLLRQLLEKAMTTALSPKEQQKVSSVLRDDPTMVIDCGMTPQKLPQLVEKNSSVSVEVLQWLPAEELPSYLNVLVTMDISLHSVDVMNRLTTSSSVQVPESYIHKYVANCIASCQNIGDKYVQTRLVRLMCVFLQSLMRTHRLSANNFVEVQAFCIEFSRIKEAANLFRQLKSLEQ